MGQLYRNFFSIWASFEEEHGNSQKSQDIIRKGRQCDKPTVELCEQEDAFKLFLHCETRCNLCARRRASTEGGDVVRGLLATKPAAPASAKPSAAGAAGPSTAALTAAAADITLSLPADFAAIGITPAKRTKVDAARLLSTASKNRNRLRPMEARRLGEIRAVEACNLLSFSPLLLDYFPRQAHPSAAMLWLVLCKRATRTRTRPK